eukprot:gene12295-2941_t
MVLDVGVREIFIDAQRKVNVRANLVSKLKKIYETDEKEFFAAFTKLAKHSLVVYTREPAVERTIDFIVAFAVAEHNKSPSKVHEQLQNGNFSDEEEEVMSPFLSNFFNFLLDLHDSHSKAVRFRVCQIINKLFDGLSDNISIDEELANRVYDCMLIRLIDKFPIIRVQAVKAIYRLQDVQDPSCPVIESFIHLMEKDSSPDVRRAALQNIAVTHKTLLHILNRTRDVKNAVRKAAYEVLAEKVKIKSLTIAQRLKLLDDGLNERSAIVKKACIGTLLKAWLVDLDENVPSLLKCLHVESSPETSLLALKALFENATEDAVKKHIQYLRDLPQVEAESDCVLIEHDHLVPEVAIYWRSLAQHVKSMDNNDELMEFASNHKLVDETGGDDEAVQQADFVMQQLLLLCGCLDYTDEIGRKKMQTLTRKLFLDENTPFTLVENLVARFVETETDEEKCLQSFVEFIAEIKEPMIVEEVAKNPEDVRKKEIELAKLKIELIELRESLDEAIKEEQFTKAAEVKEQIAKLEESANDLKNASQPQSQAIRVEKNDSFTILKCLYIASEMLQKVHKRVLTPTIKSLAETLIWPSVQDEDMLIRNAAIKCVGLISLLDKDFATENFVLFLQAAQIDTELVQITATQVIFDLIQLYGFDAFETNKNSAPVNQQQKNGFPEDDDSSEDGQSPTQNSDSEARSLLSLGTGEQASASEIILNALVVLLDGESPDIRFVVAEGMCKLLLSGRIRSAKLYAHLVLLWYNPAVSDDFKLKQCLGVFLPNFALASRSNQELVEESFFPILETLFDAPDSSPLTEVDPLIVVELLVQLTSLRNRQNHATSNGFPPTADQDFNVHDSMAVKVANEILSESDNIDLRMLCKTLSLLEISPGNEMVVKDLSILCNRILEDLDDKVCYKFIQKFQATLPVLDKEVSDQNSVPPDSNTAIQDDDNQIKSPENEPEDVTMVDAAAEMSTQNNNTQSKRMRGTRPSAARSKSQKKTGRGTNRSQKKDIVKDASNEERETRESNVKPTRRVLSSRSGLKTKTGLDLLRQDF